MGIVVFSGEVIPLCRRLGRCKRLNLKSCQVRLWQLEDELVLKGGGDVMSIIGSERQQPGWDKARE
jgi:hypothetical protein